MQYISGNQYQGSFVEGQKHGFGVSIETKQAFYERWEMGVQQSRTLVPFGMSITSTFRLVETLVN
jgi:hypothetical protein